MARVWCLVVLVIICLSIQSVNCQITTVKNVATTKAVQPAKSTTIVVTLKPATTAKSGKTVKTAPSAKTTPTVKTALGGKATVTLSTTISSKSVPIVKTTPTPKTTVTVKTVPPVKGKPTAKTTPTISTTTSPTTTTETTVVTTQTAETTVVHTTSTETTHKNNPLITNSTLQTQTTTPTQTTTQPTPRNVNPYQLVENCKSADPDFISKLERGLPNDDRFKRFLKCIYVGKNAMTESGEINNQVIMTFLLRRLRSLRLAQSVFQRCVRKADTPENTAYMITTCFRDNRVNVFTRGRRQN